MLYNQYSSRMYRNDRHDECEDLCDNRYECCRCTGPTGPRGEATIIKGSYNTYCDLVIAHPIGTKGDAYLVNGELYVWDEHAGKFGKWKSVGSILGPTGATSPHIYAQL